MLDENSDLCIAADVQEVGLAKDSDMVEDGAEMMRAKLMTWTWMSTSVPQMHRAQFKIHSNIFI